MPPYTYLLRERLTLARQLLETTPMPVKEIADRLRYADQYYFSNAFKKETGLSPTAFREQRRKLPGGK
jgi:AraC-like DNA-binding protein